MTVLASSCIREVERIRLKERRKSCAARVEEEGRHAVSKVKIAAGRQIAVEDSKPVQHSAGRERERERERG